MVSFQIDGRRVNVEEGTTVLQAALKVGINIPYLCYHPDMEPYGGCRLCMVEVTDRGFTRLQPSCAYPVKEGIGVRTNTETLIRGRKMIAELLLARCPEVQAVKNIAESLGVTSTRFAKDNKNCVLCGQCVRICQNVVGVGAIDFVGRGNKRYVGTPFDLPSEVCIGCGSCAYVCPTGAMKMEYENTLKWRNLPGPLRKCRYMRMGLISHKICPTNYECWNCEVDQRMEDLAVSHPVFMLKAAREKERQVVGKFEILFDRLYGEGHVWVKRMDGLVRMGADDFTCKILGRISDVKVPAKNTVLKPGNPIWVLSGGGKTLHMCAPLEGKIVDVNPDVLDNPSLISMAPYERGWIAIMEPKDIIRASRELRSGRAAKEWLKLDSHRFFDLIDKKTDMNFSTDRPFSGDLAAAIDKEVWNEIDRAFFMGK